MRSVGKGVGAGGTPSYRSTPLGILPKKEARKCLFQRRRRPRAVMARSVLQTKIEQTEVLLSAAPRFIC